MAETPSRATSDVTTHAAPTADDLASLLAKTRIDDAPSVAESAASVVATRAAPTVDDLASLLDKTRIDDAPAASANDVISSYDAQKVIADLAAQGITISPADVEGKTLGEVLRLIARLTAEARAKADAARKKTDEMLQRAEAVIKRDEEAYRKRMKPEIERLKRIAAAGYKGEIGLKVAQELMLDRESTEPAELFAALSGEIEKTSAAASERDALAKLLADANAEKAELQLQLDAMRATRDSSGAL